MQPIIGQPATRQDAKLKVTGAAKYSAEFALPGMVYAVLVTAPIGRGTIRTLDVAAARSATGVLAVISHLDKPRLAPLDPKALARAEATLGEGLLPFQSADIVYNGQAIAVVVADTYERARDAATLVVAQFDALPPSTTLRDTPNIDAPEELNGDPVQVTRGAPGATYAGATRKTEATYHVANLHHNPIEPHAQIAHFHDGGLTTYQSSQGVTASQATIAYLFELAPEKVRTINYFTGGGFGGKAFNWSHDIACVIAARAVRRPVKLALMRQQMFAGVGHRGETEMQMQVATDAQGQIEMLAMNTLTQGHQNQPTVFEGAGVLSKVLYPAPNFEMTHRVARNNVSPPTYMRAPGKTPGAFGLECVLDEMAHELGLDPLELRRQNYTEIDPESGLPFSSKQLLKCYERGAALIGWSARAMQPRLKRDGRYLVGYGMASAIYPALRSAASANCRIYGDGRAVAASSGVDIGTGAYTIFRQVAADTLGFPLYKVVFELGDTKLPYSPIAGGSRLTASVAPAVLEACEMAMRQVALLAIKDRRSPLYNRKLDEIEFKNGLAVLKADGAKGEALSAIVRRSGQPFVEACCRAETMMSAKGNEGLKQKRRAPCDRIAPDAETDHNEEKYAFFSFGAQFCKLRVDEEMGTIRLLDWASVMDCGRILNPRTARSQILGGVGFGIGMALSEETLYDPNTARPYIRNLADYHVAVNGDVPRIQVEFIDIPDPHINSLGCRGVGEIGIVGVPAAIGNAVFNATGKRLRELPMTPDKFVV